MPRAAHLSEVEPADTAEPEQPAGMKDTKTPLTSWHTHDGGAAVFGWALSVGRMLRPDAIRRAQLRELRTRSERVFVEAERAGGDRLIDGGGHGMLE